MRFTKWLLGIIGWRAEVSVPDYPKCIICVAPHTSNWDFIIAEIAYTSVGRHAGFLMKAQWFFWPLGCFFRSIGGIAVHRKNKKTSLTDEVVELFGRKDRLQIAITPEGTRSANAKWHTGFLHIARQANVPVVLGIIDYEHKAVIIKDEFTPSDNVEDDIKRIKNYYKDFKGKYPEKCITD